MSAVGSEMPPDLPKVKALSAWQTIEIVVGSKLVGRSSFEMQVIKGTQ